MPLILCAGISTKMAMPRPSGKALRIAQETIPGLRGYPSKKATGARLRVKKSVEEMQTAEILDPGNIKMRNFT